MLLYSIIKRPTLLGLVRNSSNFGIPPDGDAPFPSSPAVLDLLLPAPPVGRGRGVGIVGVGSLIVVATGEGDFESGVVIHIYS